MGRARYGWDMEHAPLPGGRSRGRVPASLSGVVDDTQLKHSEALLEATTRPLDEVARGAAGLYSAILAGWPGGRAWRHSHPITREIET